jgi:hypothetical protein
MVDAGGRDAQVNAALLTELLVETNSGRSAATALRLAGARITGTVDLRHSQVNRPFIAEGCYFDEPVDLIGAQLSWFEVRDSSIPSIGTSP